MNANSAAELLETDENIRKAWSRQDAAHLLCRAQHGASAADIDRAIADGLGATVDRLTSPQPETPEFESTDRILRRVADKSGNIDDLKVWWANRLLHSANPLAEKLTLLWHNHFATSNAKVRSSGQMAAQNALFRQHALGSFRELLHGIARDVAMLVWLDSNANRNRQPNENFARELLELFALGVGNYTEKDIQEAARAFTGWHVRDGKFWFNRIQHDTRSKTVFSKTGNFDGDEIINLCLEQPAAPRFIAKKLLQTFVMPEPSAVAIDTVADSIRRHDFVIAPVLGELFRSRLFFSSEVRGSLIKSPADLVLGSLRALDAQANLAAAVQSMARLGQNLFEPPTVKGWEGNRLWINSASMLARANFAAELVTGSSLGTIANPAQLKLNQNGRELPDRVAYYVGLLLRRSDPGVSETIAGRLASASGGNDLKLRSAIYAIATLPEYQLL